jgi:polar amino acid transport system permease protein
VVLPLAFRLCLPALNNNLVNLLKSTTMAYAIGVPEVLYVSAQIWSDEFNATEMMLVVLVVYAGITTALIGMMQFWEQRLKIPGYGA